MCRIAHPPARHSKRRENPSRPINVFIVIASDAFKFMVVVVVMVDFVGSNSKSCYAVLQSP